MAFPIPPFLVINNNYPLLFKHVWLILFTSDKRLWNWTRPIVLPEILNCPASYVTEGENGAQKSWEEKGFAQGHTNVCCYRTTWQCLTIALSISWGLSPFQSCPLLFSCCRVLSSSSLDVQVLSHGAPPSDMFFPWSISTYIYPLFPWYIISL